MRRRVHAALLREAVRIRRRQPPPHPGAGYPNFPCLPLPDPLPPNSEEVAPWDDPTAMSYEDLAELIGL